MSKLTLPFLETMITQVCNLSCTGCTNYSDLSHRGYVPWNTGKQQLVEWLDCINIQEFGIMGGEPMINPEWQQWVAGARQLMPRARIRFTTNGLLLHKAPDIVDFFEQVGDVTFKITVHIQDQALEDHITSIFQSRDWQPVREFGIDRWQGRNGVKFQINRPREFLKTYRGSYTDMRPWHSQPVDAFEACCQKTCPLLYNSKIYKCSTAGLLVDTLDRFDYPNWAEWENYVDRGIGVDSSSEEIAAFLNNFGKPNRICGQCPTTSSTGSRLVHHLTVKRK